MIIIGEKLNGSIPSMAKAIAEKNEDYIRDLAQKQSAAGAHFLDVCASVPEERELEVLKWLIDIVQDVTDTPICVDSPSAKVCAEAVKFCKKPGLINSVSGEGEKINMVFPVISGTEWECVALLSDDKGIPRTTERRIEVFQNIMKRAKEFNIAPNRLHIDPLIEMLAASEDGIVKVTDTIKQVKELYPAIHVTGGASNISFNLPARKYINRAFIILAMNAGMDSAILDPLNKDMMGLLYAAEALLGKDEYCLEYINAFRSGLFGA
ncbi:MAG: methyltetrahydrofolate cobalamin methyltransferase [Treponema sp.]|jgi:5-methyltetrahydrofolate--homocysteine methyltransferase|nr:methyltetrahydrofolate cobalamin methyltransferase [Treponema sp.]